MTVKRPIDKHLLALLRERNVLKIGSDIKYGEALSLKCLAAVRIAGGYAFVRPWVRKYLELYDIDAAADTFVLESKCVSVPKALLRFVERLCEDKRLPVSNLSELVRTLLADFADVLVTDDTRSLQEASRLLPGLKLLVKSYQHKYRYLCEKEKSIEQYKALSQKLDLIVTVLERLRQRLDKLLSLLDTVLDVANRAVREPTDENVFELSRLYDELKELVAKISESAKCLCSRIKEVLNGTWQL